TPRQQQETQGNPYAKPYLSSLVKDSLNASGEESTTTAGSGKRKSALRNAGILAGVLETPLTIESRTRSRRSVATKSDTPTKPKEASDAVENMISPKVPKATRRSVAS